MKYEVKVSEEKDFVRENIVTESGHMLEVEAWTCNLCRYPATRRLQEQGDWPKEATGITTWKGSGGQGGHQTCSGERGGEKVG